MNICHLKINSMVTKQFAIDKFHCAIIWSDASADVSGSLDQISLTNLLNKSLERISWTNLSNECITWTILLNKFPEQFWWVEIFHLIVFYPRARQASAKESALDYDHIGTFMNQPPPRTRSLILIDE